MKMKTKTFLTLIAVGLSLPFSAIAQVPPTDFMCDATDSNVARFGRDNGGSFQSLIEMNTQQTLTGFSGTQIGRGAIKLNDTIDGDSMELGFYQFGAGIFHPGLFEFWTNGVSVRQLGGSIPSYIDVRDVNDEKQLRFSHNVANGVISTDDEPWNTGLAGGVSIRPNSDESWLFEQNTGNLKGNSTYGGYLIFTKGQKTVVETVDDNVAATGRTQGTANLLLKTHNTIKTTGPNDDGVILPAVTAEMIGSHIDTVNTDLSRSVKVYPAVGDEINSRGVNTPFSLSPQKFFWCRATSVGHWRCGVSG